MPVPEERGAVQRALLKDNAYDTLCEAIVNGTLAPGETLRDDELCSWLGLSRTPVRGALARLEGEGLVETRPQRFTRVSAVDEGDAQTLFPVLAGMHALAVELAVPKLQGPDLLLLRDLNDRHIAALTARNLRAAYDSDDAFHEVFLRASGNPDVMRVLMGLQPRMHRLENLHSGALPGRRALAQHEAIIARAAAGDAASAASATREHWLSVGTLVERALAG
jgi:DNA-binding GntR family transcriptional regulator